MEEPVKLFFMRTYILFRDLKMIKVNFSWKERAYENESEILMLANKMKEGL